MEEYFKIKRSENLSTKLVRNDRMIFTYTLKHIMDQDFEKQSDDVYVKSKITEFLKENLGDRKDLSLISESYLKKYKGFKKECNRNDVMGNINEIIKHAMNY